MKNNILSKQNLVAQINSYCHQLFYVIDFEWQKEKKEKK